MPRGQYVKPVERYVSPLKDDTINIVDNRPSLTRVALVYFFIAGCAMAVASVVFYLLLVREANAIKERNGGTVS
nr:hypothetical protein [Sicyoidochytrium minutum DNA virus]